jgi:hypothetical protein
MDWRRKLRAKTIRLNRAYKRDVAGALAEGFVPYRDAEKLIEQAVAEAQGDAGNGQEAKP